MRNFNLYKLINKLILLMIFLLEIQFFFLINSDTIYKVNNRTQKILIVCIIIYGLFLTINLIIRSKKFVFNKYIYFFILFCICEMLISVYRYDFSLITVLKTSNYIFVILAYYIFVTYIRIEGKDKFINIIMLFTSLCSFLFIVQYFLYPRYGFFLSIHTYGYRFSSLRYYEGEGLLGVGAIIAFGFLVNNNFKLYILPYLTFILGLLVMIFAYKSRMGILCMIVTCLFVYLAKNIKSISKLFVFMVFIFLLYGIVNNTTIFNNYVNSFSSNDYSYITRQQEINFYLDQFKDNKLLGMSFIPFDPSSKTYWLITGPYGNYYKDDVGYIGFLNTFGLIGMAWLLLLLVKIIKILFTSFQDKTITNNYEVLALLIYIVLTSWTANVMDPQRIIALPILLALVTQLSEINTKNKIYK